MPITWWIDEPWVMASSNPSDQDLAHIRSHGFGVLVSLLDENQCPNYDKKSAELADWILYALPIKENCAPTPREINKFAKLRRTLPKNEDSLALRERLRPFGVHGCFVLGCERPHGRDSYQKSTSGTAKRRLRYR